MGGLAAEAGGDEVLVRADLTGDALSIPAQLGGHEGRDLLGRRDAAVADLGGQARAALDDVVQVDDALGPGRVDDLGAQVARRLGERDAQGRVAVDQVEHVAQHGAVAEQEPVHAGLVQAVVGGDAVRLRLDLRVAEAAEHGDVLGEAGTGRVGLAHHEVHDVLGHGPVRGPLAAGHGGEAGGHLGDGVLTGDLGGGAVGAGDRLQQRPQAGVRGDHVVTREVLLQHRVGVLEDVVDVVRGGGRMGHVLRPRGVRGADHPVLVPRDEEQHGLLRLGDHAGGGVGADALARDGDVGALGGEHLEAAVGLGQLLLLLGPHAPGQDDGARVHVELLAGGLLADTHALHTAVVAAQVAGDGGVVGGHGAVVHGGAHEHHGQAGVVELGVGVLHRADDLLVVEGGEGRGHGAAAEMAVRAHRAAAAERLHGVVHGDAGADEAAVDHLVEEREDEAQGAHQVGRGLGEQQVALTQRLVHQLDVQHLEVAQATVHEAGGAGRGPGGPVAGLDDAHVEAAGGRVERGAHAGGAAAHDQDVEGGLRAGGPEAGEVILPRGGGEGDGSQGRHGGVAPLSVEAQCSGVAHDTWCHITRFGINTSRGPRCHPRASGMHAAATRRVGVVRPPTTCR